MSYAFLVQQMTMTIELLATACFVCAQVKVEHPVFFPISSFIHHFYFKKAIHCPDRTQWKLSHDMLPNDINTFLGHL